MTRGKGRRRGGKNSSLTLVPPPLKTTMSFGHVFRFSNGSNSGTFNIKWAQIFNLLQVATSTTTTTRVIASAKVKRISMWANPPALGSAPTVLSLEWAASQHNEAIQTSDTTMGVRPARVTSKPPLNSAASWSGLSNSDDNTALVNLILPADTIIDVHVSLRLVDDEAAVAGETISGGISGTMYYGYLDGLSSGKLAPVGSVNLLP
jgi:hypothetical protein